MLRSRRSWRSSGALIGSAVLAASVLAGLPASADPAGSISGRVTDSAGGPLPDICVNVENGPGTATDSSGLYVLEGLDTGAYKIFYSDCGATPRFVSQWYAGRTDPGLADPVSVTDGADSPLVDVALTEGVSVHGTVTDGSGAPLAGILVNVNPVDSGMSTGTMTDPTGSYVTSPLPPGDYKVQFADGSPTPVWARQYWASKHSWNSADVLTLTASDGAVRSGVDAQLSESATVAGRVAGPDGAPLAGICVAAYVAASNGGIDWLNGTTTAADGTYLIDQLPPTDVRVHFQPCSGSGQLIDQWYPAQVGFETASPVSLTPGAHAESIDAQLGEGVSIGGRVTDPEGNPLAGIYVSVNPTGSGGGGWAQTDANGDFLTTPVVPGTYRVQFNSGDGAWASQFWDRALSWNNASILTVVQDDGPVLAGVDAVLTAAASVAGTVTGPGGESVSGICVSAYVDASEGYDWVGSTTTGADGDYRIGGLPATDVRIAFEDCSAVGPYMGEWWDGATDYDDAQALALTPGDARSAIDAQLAAAAAIRGKVTDAEGDPLEGICVQATTSTFFGGITGTDAQGGYSIVLARAGDYRVQFFDCTDNPAHAGEWWNDQPTMAEAQAIEVSLGETVMGVDAALVSAPPSSISGRVVNLHGVAVTQACVVAYIPNQYARFAPVGADGAYSLDGIPSGTYALGFVGCPNGEPDALVPDPDAPGTNHRAVWWRGAPIDLGQSANGGPDPIAQGASLVDVPPGQHLSGFDWCFGCGAIAISSVTADDDALTIAFTTPGLAGHDSQLLIAESSEVAPLTYVADCSADDGRKTQSGPGSGSPVTWAGLQPGTYQCTVTAYDAATAVARSAPSDPVEVRGTADGPSPTSPPVDDPAPSVDTPPAPAPGDALPADAPPTTAVDLGADPTPPPAPPVVVLGTLAFTGARGTIPLALLGFGCLTAGAALVLLNRRRRLARA